jgi:hypothetical protein
MVAALGWTGSRTGCAPWSVTPWRLVVSNPVSDHLLSLAQCRRRNQSFNQRPFRSVSQDRFQNGSRSESLSLLVDTLNDTVQLRKPFVHVADGEVSVVATSG